MPATLSVPAVEEGPDYFERQFSQGDVFLCTAGRPRPPGLPAQVWTTETTHRDGQQGGLPLTTEQSIRIYEILCRFTRNSGAIRQAEFFCLPPFRSGFAGGRHNGASKTVIRSSQTAWIRASTKDVKLIHSLGVRESGLLASVSDYHVFSQICSGRTKTGRFTLPGCGTNGVR